jgi:hypothetical protein
MKYNRRAGPLHRQRGVAAIEMAILLSIFISMMALPLFVGRCLWHYTVVQKAAHDSARYLATIPLADVRNPTRAAAAIKVAEYIVARETAELNPGGIYPVSVTINCLPDTCTLGSWGTIKVYVGVKMFDPILPDLTEKIVPAAKNGLLFNSEVEMYYVGT